MTNPNLGGRPIFLIRTRRVLLHLAEKPSCLPLRPQPYLAGASGAVVGGCHRSASVQADDDSAAWEARATLPGMLTSGAIFADDT
jgi:hypothetical protein